MNRRCEESVPLLGPLLDGELGEEDRAWLADHVRSCDTCTRRRDLLAAQRDAVCDAVVARARAADFSGFADKVLGRIANDREPAKVVRLRVWGTETWRAYRRPISAAAGLAVAASLALFAVLSPQRTDPRGTVLLADARAPGTVVEEVDFENHEGAVLQSGQTTVIWLDDDAPAVLR